GTFGNQHLLVDEIFINCLLRNTHFAGNVVHGNTFETKFQKHVSCLCNNLLFHCFIANLRRKGNQETFNTKIVSDVFIVFLTNSVASLLLTEQKYSNLAETYRMHSVEHYRRHFLEYLDEQRILRPPENLYEPIDYILRLPGKRIRPLL